MNRVAYATGNVAKLYWLTLSSTLAFGFFVNYLMVTNIPAEVILSINPWVILIGYFVICFSGIYLSVKSDDPKISFLGYMMVVIPVGIVIIPFIQSVDPAIVEKATLFTALLSVMMGLGGVMHPQFFSKIGGILIWGLIASIIAEVVLMLLGYDLVAMDWIVAVIFLGFIGYDFAMALHDEPTVDAAIDRAVALYLDIINLFIRILSIMSKSKN